MAPLLSAEALASLRTFQAAYGLPDQVVLMARTAGGSDGSGGQTVTYPDGATVAARLTPAAGLVHEAIVAERPTAREPMLIELPYGTTITPADRVREVGTARVYEVVGVPQQSWARTTNVYAVRLA